MGANINPTTQNRVHILMLAANPVPTPLGYTAGFWGSELTHPFYAFSEVGYHIALASPAGGEIAMDDLSDPRHPRTFSEERVFSRRLDYDGVRQYTETDGSAFQNEKAR